MLNAGDNQNGNKTSRLSLRGLKRKQARMTGFINLSHEEFINENISFNMNR